MERTSWVGAAEPSVRRLGSPVVVTALLWVGVQVLVLLYLRSLLGPAIARGEPDAVRLLAALATGSADGWSVRQWLFGTNVLFVVLLWLRFRSLGWTGRSERRLGVAVYGGTAALVLLTHLAWETMLRMEIPWSLQRLPL